MVVIVIHGACSALLAVFWIGDVPRLRRTVLRRQDRSVVVESANTIPIRELNPSRCL